MTVPDELYDLFDRAEADNAGVTSTDIHGTRAALAALLDHAATCVLVAFAKADQEGVSLDAMTVDDRACFVMDAIRGES